jgi:hypothetical protein
MTMKDVDVSLDDDQPEGEAGKTDKSDKSEKNRLVRNSFTIPKAEYSTLNELKQRATTLAQPAKKSELLRAGIALLKSLTDDAFKQALAAVPNLKTGRPPKEGEEGEGEAPAPRVGRKIIDKIDRSAKSGARAKTSRTKAAGGAAKPARTANKSANKSANKAANKANKPAKADNPARAANKAANKSGKADNPGRAAKLAARNKTAA